MKNKTIKEIKAILSADPNEEILSEFQADQRVGVQNLLKRYYREQERQLEKIKIFHQKETLERPFWDQGKYVVGVDEVGRGPLAGPVVTAAVVLPADNTLYDVDDSKKLTGKKRDLIYKQICEQATDISVAVGSPEMIDQFNIYHATELIMKEAITNLYLTPDHILVDAMTIPVNIGQTKLIKGDAKSLSIGAASIIAKVYRDRLMLKYDRKFPEFGFANNDGYGTKQHLEALDQFGKTPIHRESFSPVKEITKLYQIPSA